MPIQILEPEDIVDGVSNAIIKILRYSPDDHFVSRVFSVLQASCLEEAVQHLKHNVWITLHKIQGVDIPPHVADEITSIPFQQEIATRSLNIQEEAIETEQSQSILQCNVHYLEEQEFHNSCPSFINSDYPATENGNQELSSLVPLHHHEFLFQMPDATSDVQRNVSGFQSLEKFIASSPPFSIYESAKRLPDTPAGIPVAVSSEQYLGHSEFSNELEACNDHRSLGLPVNTEGFVLATPSLEFTDRKSPQKNPHEGTVENSNKQHSEDSENVQLNKTREKVSSEIDEAINLIADSSDIKLTHDGSSTLIESNDMYKEEEDVYADVAQTREQKLSNDHIEESLSLLSSQLCLPLAKHESLEICAESAYLEGLHKRTSYTSQENEKQLSEPPKSHSVDFTDLIDMALVKLSRNLPHSCQEQGCSPFIADIQAKLTTHHCDENAYLEECHKRTAYSTSQKNEKQLSEPRKNHFVDFTDVIDVAIMKLSPNLPRSCQEQGCSPFIADMQTKLDTGQWEERIQSIGLLQNIGVDTTDSSHEAQDSQLSLEKVNGSSKRTFDENVNDDDYPCSKKVCKDNSSVRESGKATESKSAASGLTQTNARNHLKMSTNLGNLHNSGDNEDMLMFIENELDSDLNISESFDEDEILGLNNINENDCHIQDHHSVVSKSASNEDVTEKGLNLPKLSSIDAQSFTENDPKVTTCIVSQKNCANPDLVSNVSDLCQTGSDKNSPLISTSSFVCDKYLTSVEKCDLNLHSNSVTKIADKNNFSELAASTLKSNYVGTDVCYEDKDTVKASNILMTSTSGKDHEISSAVVQPRKELPASASTNVNEACPKNLTSITTDNPNESVNSTVWCSLSGFDTDDITFSDVDSLNNTSYSNENEQCNFISQIKEKTQQPANDEITLIEENINDSNASQLIPGEPLLASSPIVDMHNGSKGEKRPISFNDTSVVACNIQLSYDEDIIRDQIVSDKDTDGEDKICESDEDSQSLLCKGLPDTEAENEICESDDEESQSLLCKGIPYTEEEDEVCESDDEESQSLLCKGVGPLPESELKLALSLGCKPIDSPSCSQKSPFIRNNQEIDLQDKVQQGNSSDRVEPYEDADSSTHEVVSSVRKQGLTERSQYLSEDVCEGGSVKQRIPSQSTESMGDQSDEIKETDGVSNHLVTSNDTCLFKSSDFCVLSLSSSLESYHSPSSQDDTNDDRNTSLLHGESHNFDGDKSYFVTLDERRPPITNCINDEKDEQADHGMREKLGLVSDGQRSLSFDSSCSITPSHKPSLYKNDMEDHIVTSVPENENVSEAPQVLPTLETSVNGISTYISSHSEVSDNTEVCDKDVVQPFSGVSHNEDDEYPQVVCEVGKHESISVHADTQTCSSEFMINQRFLDDLVSKYLPVTFSQSSDNIEDNTWHALDNSVQDALQEDSLLAEESYPENSLLCDETVNISNNESGSDTCDTRNISEDNDTVTTSLKTQTKIPYSSDKESSESLQKLTEDQRGLTQPTKNCISIATSEKDKQDENENIPVFQACIVTDTKASEDSQQHGNNNGARRKQVAKLVTDTRIDDKASSIEECKKIVINTGASFLKAEVLGDADIRGTFPDPHETTRLTENVEPSESTMLSRSNNAVGNVTSFENETTTRSSLGNGSIEIMDWDILIPLFVAMTIEAPRVPDRNVPDQLNYKIDACNDENAMDLE